MNYIPVIVALFAAGSYPAFAQNNSDGSAAAQTSTDSSTVQGAAGTNVGGTVHTNQGNQFGNSATGAPTTGMSRTGQPAADRPQTGKAPSKPVPQPGVAGGSPTNKGGSPGTSSRQ
jgi:hypothetical protein